VRTDNILILFAVLVCLAWKQRLPRSIAAVLAAFAIGIVLGINHWAGNYGWIVLFRFSFISGRYPAQIPHVLTIREYQYCPEDDDGSLPNRLKGNGLAVI
jgi:hypothetical protein